MALCLPSEQVWTEGAIQAKDHFMSSKFVGLLDGGMAEAVNALRLAEYSKAAGFEVKPPGVLWNRSDDQSTVIGAWSEGELLATLRLELVDSMELVERKMECPWSFPIALRLPVMVLSKMATRSSCRGQGLNALLRYWALELARGWEIQQVIGTFVSGSPRERSMREMGYEFFTNERGWFAGDYKSTSPVLVCVLDMSRNGQQAIDVCRRIAGRSLAEYPWAGARPEKRLVQVVK